MLNAGTYTLHRASTTCYGKTLDFSFGVYQSGLCLTDKSVVLRGQGPGNTIINYGDGANIISMGKTYESSSNVTMISVTNSPTKGTNQVTVSSASGISVGSYIVVTELNPSDPADGNPLINTIGYTGSCSGCGNNLPNNLISQIEKVTAVNGNTLTVEIPLYFDYTNTPTIFRLPNMIESVGLESLTVRGTASSGTNLTYKNVNMQSCSHCWVHNVEVDNVVDKSAIYLTDVYSSEISNNYLNNDLWTGSVNPSVGSYFAVNHNSGADYSMLLEFRASNNLIQNNIIRKARHSTPQSGCSGNVYGYNYELDAYMGEYHNSLPETQAHAAHPFMNLWEGNVTPNWEFDFAHGSSSHNTMFRNYINMASTNPDTGAPMTGALIAINVAYYSNYENVIGNVFGPYGSSCTATAYETDADAREVNGVIYQLGYYDSGGSASPNLTLSAKVGQTILRGGNWDCVTNSVVWNNDVPSGSLVSSYIAPQALPSSLYLTANPSWFGGAVWPPIDPVASTKVNEIPSEICYESGPKNGATFAPSSCYQPAQVLPPTNLVVTVQ